MTDNAIHRTFTAALDTLVAQLKQDRSVLAVLLCGSLSHDTVWAKSDIDLAVVTVDDRKIEGGMMALNADGVNVHAFIIPRTEFRRLVEGSIQHTFMHSLLAKGRLLYTHDDTVARLCEGLREMGARDRQVQLLRSGAHALAAIYKAHKWMVTRGDLDYTALWILYAATSLADQLLPGTHVDLQQRSTQCLSEFSLDFDTNSGFTAGNPPQDLGTHLTVNAITINGQPATFTFKQPTYPGDPNGQDDPDPLIGLENVAHHLAIARLEDVQRQARVRKEDEVRQRKERQQKLAFGKRR